MGNFSQNFSRLHNILWRGAIKIGSAKYLTDAYGITTSNKSTSVRVTPFGLPRSIYKSDVERCFLKFWVEMAKSPWLKININEPHFQHQLIEFRDACFVLIEDTSPYSLQIIT